MVRAAAMTLFLLVVPSGVLSQVSVSAVVKEQSAPVGQIRICQRRGTTSINDHKTVTIPKGTGYTSADGPNGERLPPFFTVHLTHDVALPPKPGCVTADAVLDENPSRGALTVGYGRDLLSQFSAPGMDDYARVVADFK